MLPRNIDLTEHGDFGPGDGEELIDNLTHTVDTLLYYGDVVDNDCMSVDQYMLILQWERIFGKTRHTNMKSQIFGGKLPFKDDNRYGTKCRRCGRNISAPWNRVYDMCKDCHNTLEMGIQQIPWRPNNLRVVRRGDRGQGDLFELR